MKKLSFLQTARNIIQKHGVGVLWSGIGPALILVINPIIQVGIYTRMFTKPGY
jgi:adenine nucleotide transporter 17